MNQFVIQIGFSPEVVDALLDEDFTRRTKTLIKCHLIFDKAIDNALEQHREDEDEQLHRR